MKRHGNILFAILLLVSDVSLLLAGVSDDRPWPRHTIDDDSQGADGVRLADVNADGLMDLATGWEEGGVIRVYVNPGPAGATRPWPAVTVGRCPSPEDAVLADLDGDGAVDVVTSCEGRTQTVFFHWAPKDPASYLDARRWHTVAAAATVGRSRWMFAMPLQIDGRFGLDLVVGSKSPNGMIGWLQAPGNARDADGWKLHRLYSAGWIMSLEAVDLDHDGDADILASDRYGTSSGVLWLENPGVEQTADANWNQHRIGLGGEQVMFLDVADMNRDGRIDIVATAKPRRISLLLQPVSPSSAWVEHATEFPESEFGTAKSARVGDLNQDGHPDIVITCEHAAEDRCGVFWLPCRNGRADPSRGLHRIAGSQGVKFDLTQLLDLDGDSDLDVVTCEEAENLGVIWYENPIVP